MGKKQTVLIPKCIPSTLYCAQFQSFDGIDFTFGLSLGGPGGMNQLVYF